MEPNTDRKGPIGVFDSGYGGITILRAICDKLPQYNYLYLGDNARAPYGPRSFDVVYRFTLQAVKYMFAQGCKLIILACNTASAKALRSIQTLYLPENAPDRRVLGVIRPTVEILPEITRNGHVGLLATAGTVASHSYQLEATKLNPDIRMHEQACPLLVPLIENGEAESPATEWFVNKYLSELMAADADIDTIVLGCTHYPIIKKIIESQIPENVNLIEQGPLVADSLADYLQRHPEIDHLCAKHSERKFLTTEEPDKFDTMASLFMGNEVRSKKIDLEP